LDLGLTQKEAAEELEVRSRLTLRITVTLTASSFPPPCESLWSMPAIPCQRASSRRLSWTCRWTMWSSVCRSRQSPRVL